LLTISQGRFQHDKVFKRFDELLNCQSRASYYHNHLQRNAGGLLGGGGGGVGAGEDSSNNRNNKLSSSGGSSLSSSAILGTDTHLYEQTASCKFPGIRMFQLTKQLNELIKRINDYMYDVT